MVQDKTDESNGEKNVREEREERNVEDGEMTEAAREAEEAGSERVAFKEEDEVETQQSLEATSTPTDPKGHPWCRRIQMKDTTWSINWFLPNSTS